MFRKSKKDHKINKWDILLGIFFSKATLAASIFQNSAESWSAKYYCVAVTEIRWLMTSQQSRSDNASLLLYYYTLSRMRHTFWDFVLLSNVAGLGSD